MMGFESTNRWAMPSLFVWTAVLFIRVTESSSADFIGTCNDQCSNDLTIGNYMNWANADGSNILPNNDALIQFVNVADQFYVGFGVVIKSLPNGDAKIFNVGNKVVNDEYERRYTRMSPQVLINDGRDLGIYFTSADPDDVAIEWIKLQNLDTEYRIEIVVCNGIIQSYRNGQPVGTVSTNAGVATGSAQVWFAPDTNVADVELTGLEIRPLCQMNRVYSCDAQCSTSALTEDFFFYQKSDFVPSDTTSIGTVSIGDSLYFSVDIVFHSWWTASNMWQNILRIGSAGDENDKFPGLWVAQNELKFRLQFSDQDDRQRDYSPDGSDRNKDLALDTKYTITLTVCNGVVSSYLDGALLGTRSGVTLYNHNNLDIMSAEDNHVADVTISELVVRPLCQPNRDREYTCDSQCSFDVTEEYYFYHDEDVQPVAGQSLGTVDTADTLYFSVDVVIHQWGTEEWQNIVWMENSNSERLRFGLKQSEQNFYVQVTDDSQRLEYGTTAMKFELETKYTITISVCDGVITSYINDIEIVTKTGTSMTNLNDVDIFVGYSGKTMADVTVSNLVVKPLCQPSRVYTCDSECSADVTGDNFFRREAEMVPLAGNSIGTVDIGDSISFSVDIVINSWGSTEWQYILRIGDDDATRSPGIGLEKTKQRLWMHFSDDGSFNRVYTPSTGRMEFELGTTYTIKITVCGGVVTSYINDVQIQSRTRSISNLNDANIYIAPSGQNLADVTVSNLVIEPFCQYSGYMDVRETINNYYYVHYGKIANIENNQIGKIDVSDSYFVSFDIVMHSWSWEGSNILYIGSESIIRSPGFWAFQRNKNGLTVRMSDEDSYNRDYSTNQDLQLDVQYNIELSVQNGVVSTFVDGTRVASRSDVDIILVDDAPIWTSFGSITDITLSNLEIGTFQLEETEPLDDCFYNSITFTPTFNETEVGNIVPMSDDTTTTSSSWRCRMSDSSSDETMAPCLKLELDPQVFLFTSSEYDLRITFQIECSDEEFSTDQCSPYTLITTTAMEKYLTIQAAYDTNGAGLSGTGMTEDAWDDNVFCGMGVSPSNNSNLNDATNSGYDTQTFLTAGKNFNSLTEFLEAVQGGSAATTSKQCTSLFSPTFQRAERSVTWTIKNDVLKNEMSLGLATEFWPSSQIFYRDAFLLDGDEERLQIYFFPFEQEVTYISNIKVQYVPKNSGARLCVTLHTCAGWSDSVTLSLIDTLQLVLDNSDGKKSDFLTVNNGESLPRPDEWKTYVLRQSDGADATDSLQYMSQFFSLNLAMTSNVVDFCLDGLEIQFSRFNESSVNLTSAETETYNFTSAVYPGVILSQNCDHSFFYLSTLGESLYCQEGFLKLYTNYSNLISSQMFNFKIDTCAAAGAGVELDTLQNDIKFALVGKNVHSGSWETSDLYSFDHVALHGGINWNQIGDLYAANVRIGHDGDYTEVSSHLTGTIIGIKLVVSNDDLKYQNPSYWEDLTNWQLEVVMVGSGQLYYWDLETNDPYFLSTVSVGNTGSQLDYHQWILYMVRTNENDQFDADGSSYHSSVPFDSHDLIRFQFKNAPGDSNEFAVFHVYLILEENMDEYSLPYTFVDVENSWGEAEKDCLGTYGTHLASVHSDDEQIALNLVSRRQTWMGLTDRFTETDYEWTDKSYVNYMYGTLSANYDQTDCMSNQFSNQNSVLPTVQWNSIDCTTSLTYVCARGVWPANEERVFNLPMAVAYNSDNIVLTSMHNTNEEDGLCISNIKIEVDGKDVVSQLVSPTWVGGNGGSNEADCNKYGYNSCGDASYGIFRWPVCSIQVESVFYDWSNAEFNETSDDITGLTCSNYNRLEAATCDVSKEYSFETSVTFEMSEEQTYETSSAIERSTGDSQAVESGRSFGTAFSQSDSSEFTVSDSLTVSRDITVSTGYEVGSDDIAKTTFGVEDSFGFSATSESSSTTASETGSEQSWDVSSSTLRERHSSVTTASSQTDGSSSSKTMTRSRSKTETIACVASANIPPSTSVDYTLSFIKSAAIIPTLTNLKLTLCNSDLSAEYSEPEVIYIYDVVGEIGFDATTYCNVVFSAPTMLSNTITCDEEQALAFRTQADFVPVCNATHPWYYDGCQCTGLSSYTGTPTSCSCVDRFGNNIRGKMILHEVADWRDTCRALNCEDSVFYSDGVEGDVSAIVSGTASVNTSSTSTDLSSVVMVLVCVIIALIVIVCCCAAGVFWFVKYGSKYQVFRKDSRHMQAEVEIDEAGPSVNLNDHDIEKNMPKIANAASVDFHDRNVEQQMSIQLGATKSKSGESVNLDELVSA